MVLASGLFAARCRAPPSFSPARGGGECWGAAMAGCASRRSASLFSFRREAKSNWLRCFVVVVGKTRTHTRRENDFVCPPPRNAMERGRGPPEGWWRGRAALRRATRPTPLPPRFARSPLPAVAGRRERTSVKQRREGK